MLKDIVQNESTIDDLLLEMENYEWSSVSDIPVITARNHTNPNFLNGTTWRFGMKSEGQSLRFDARQIIRHSGIVLDGSVLEFDTGSTSMGAVYPNFIAIDNDPRNVKRLRQNGIKAIIGTLEGLPFPANSFDYVIAFSPLIIRETRGWKRGNNGSNSVEVRSDYKEEIVRRAIEIAKKKVLIASIPIAVDPPFIEQAEAIVTDPRCHYYYVVYAAG